MQAQSLDEVMDLHETIEALLAAGWTVPEIHALKRDLERWKREERVLLRPR